MDSTEFKLYIQDNLEYFISEWEQKSDKNPDQYPHIMNVDDWFEMFSIFLESGKV